MVQVAGKRRFSRTPDPNFKAGGKCLANRHHHTARTPHVEPGVLASFCFASVSSAFSWYAMRQGTLLGGTDSTSLVDDVLSLPGITVSFALPFLAPC
jgi:hypothetical protein